MAFNVTDTHISAPQIIYLRNASQTLLNTECSVNSIFCVFSITKVCIICIRFNTSGSNNRVKNCKIKLIYPKCFEVLGFCGRTLLQVRNTIWPQAYEWPNRKWN